MSATPERGSADAPLARSGDVRALAFSLLAWAGSTIAAGVFVASYASPIPFMDDMEFVLRFLPDAEPTWSFLWSAANEHRIVIPRAVYSALLAITHDFRSGMYFQVLVQSVLALALILFARRLRGRASFADAFFPVLLLGWGDAANLVLGIQIATAVPTAIVCTFVMLALRRPGPPSTASACALALSVLLLPLNGGFGLMQAPPLALWMAISAWFLVRENRRSAIALVCGVVLLIALVASYFVDFSFPPGQTRTFEPVPVVRTAVQFLSLVLGPAAAEWPLPAALVAFAFAGVAAWAALRAWPRPEERFRAAAVLAGLAASCTIALSIGVSRGAGSEMAGFATRYVILPTPFFVSAYLGLCVFGPRRIASAAQTLAFIALLAAQPFDVHFGSEFGKVHRVIAEALDRSVRAKLPFDAVVEQNWIEFYPSRAGFAARLLLLREAHYPPFRAFDPGPAWGVSDPFFMFDPHPSAVDTPKPPQLRLVHGAAALVLCPGSTIRLEPRAGARELTASYGLLPLAWEARWTGGAHTEGVHVAVEWRAEGEAPRPLFERELRPYEHTEDRGIQMLRVDVPESRPGELVVITRGLSQVRSDLDWTFWKSVDVR